MSPRPIVRVFRPSVSIRARSVNFSKGNDLLADADPWLGCRGRKGAEQVTVYTRTTLLDRVERRVTGNKTAGIKGCFVLVKSRFLLTARLFSCPVKR